MQAPVFVMRNDIHGVPIPRSRLTIPLRDEDLLRFKTTVISTTATTDLVQRLVLVMTNDEAAVGSDGPHDCQAIQQDMALYVDSIRNIGVLAEVVDLDGHLVTVDILDRVYATINLVQGIDSENGDQIWTDVCFVNDGFSGPGDEMVISEIKAFTRLMSRYSYLFEKTLIDRLLAEFLSYADQMDLIASYLLESDGDKITYLQEEDNAERWTLVTKAAMKIVDADPEDQPVDLKPPTRRTRKPRKYTPYSSGAGNMMGGKAKKPRNARERFEASDIPEEHREHILREVDKLDSLPRSSTEWSMVTDYLNWVFEVPWGKTDVKEFDLKTLREELSTTHYGLEDVKDYILEHMTIERLRGGASGNVVCFVGPPGSGKTSLAQSIARVSGRSLQRIALGGMSDEAELRGHRRTYVAARPGRVIVACKQAQSLAPLIVLDELDKLGGGRQGNPSSALLELLDPEQNNNFVDRYVEVPVDLSNAMFIATANYIEQIEPALRDRLDIIQFRDYSKEERVQILSEYLLPKCIKDYRLDNHAINWEEAALDAISDIVQVRKMEQAVRRLLRQAAVQLTVYEQDEQTITQESVQKINDPAGSKKKDPIGF